MILDRIILNCKGKFWGQYVQRRQGYTPDVKSSEPVMEVQSSNTIYTPETLITDGNEVIILGIFTFSFQAHLD